MGDYITYYKPYYSYDDLGNKIDDTLNYNADIAEVVVIPDSQKSPGLRMLDERERQRTYQRLYGYQRGNNFYNEDKDRERTLTLAREAQRDYENSWQHKALTYGLAAMEGVGIGADIVSRLPVYSSLKAGTTFLRANSPWDYVEGALWGLPLAGGTSKYLWDVGGRDLAIKGAEYLTEGYNMGRKTLNKGKTLFGDMYLGRLRDTRRRLAELGSETAERMWKFREGEVLALKEESDKASQLLYKVEDATRNRQMTSAEYDHSVTKRTAPTTLSPLNLDKMSTEDILAFLEKHNVQHAKEIAESYNPVTKRFEFEGDAGSYAFDPKQAVTTGEITMQDLRTGEFKTFNLEDLVPADKTLTTYIYNPVTGLMEPPKVTVTSDVAQRTYPKAPEEFIKFLQENLDYGLEILPGSKPFGSAVNVAEGNILHNPHDFDFIMTESAMRKHPHFKEFREVIPGATWLWKYVNSAEPLDINILREVDGKAVGDRAHELYSQLYPKRYRELMLKYDAAGKTLSTELPLDMSAQELLDGYDPVIKGIMDTFGSLKDKHMARALYYLHYGKVEDVEKAFHSYANYLLGGDYVPSDIPLSEFNNPEANKLLIKELGLWSINVSDFIYNPRRMKLLFDYAVFDKTFLGRGVPNKQVAKSLTFWYPDARGGTYNGVGLNTVIGGDSRVGEVYGTIVPTRTPELTGTTPELVLGLLVKGRNLTEEEQEFVTQLAKDLNLDTIDPSSFSSILRSTEGYTGENYKEFIAKLAEKFDIPFISNGSSYGTSPYASILEDLPVSSIKQIIPRGLDRPIDSSFRDRNVAKGVSSSIQEQENAFREGTSLLSERRRRRVVYPREGWEYNPDRNLRDLALKRRQKAYERWREVLDEVWEQRNDPNINHEAVILELWDNYYLYENLLKSLRNIVNAGLGGVGLGVVVNTLKELVKKSNQRRQEYRKEKERRYQEELARIRKKK